MKHKVRRYIGLILTIFLISLCEINGSCNPLDSNKWENIQSNYDYTEKDKKPEKEKKNKKSDTDGESSFNSLFNIDLSSLKYLLYLVVVAGIIYILVRLVNGGGLNGSFKRKLKTNFDINNPDKLEKTVLDKGLSMALVDFDYRKALRFQFLILLEIMQKEKLIVWHKYKTNGEYLKEIEQKPIFKETKYLTYAYEYYWYGEHNLEKEGYAKLASKFEGQYKLISTDEK